MLELLGYSVVDVADVVRKTWMEMERLPVIPLFDSKFSHLLHEWFLNPFILRKCRELVRSSIWSCTATDVWMSSAGPAPCSKPTCGFVYQVAFAQGFGTSAESNDCPFFNVDDREGISRLADPRYQVSDTCGLISLMNSRALLTS